MTKTDLRSPQATPDLSGPALIDTHIWLWYLDGNTETMSPAAVEMLRRCLSGKGLLVSDISVWEIGNKAARGTLELLPTVSAWLERAERKPGFAFLPLDRGVLRFSTDLPGNPHGDPADRMLLATAFLHELPLITADRAIIEYARHHAGFQVYDARG